MNKLELKEYIREKHPYFFNFLKRINEMIFGFYRKSYSQFGEDVVLSTFLNEIKNGFYVDIGAYHPKRYSNTYFFYKKGWRGINIDAKPGSMKLFRKKRKRDINLEIGIFKEEKELDFYIFNSATNNTFSKKMADMYINNGEIFEKKIIVKTVTLEHILDKYLSNNQKIDFLSIDVEGLDMEVLESNNWDKYKPNFILVEMHNIAIVNIKNSEIYKFLESIGYRLISVANITFIFKYEVVI